VGAISAAERQGILRYFDEQCDNVVPADLVEVPIHGDLCPGNVLVWGSEITVLDLAMTRPGSMYTDLTHMYTHIESDRAKRWVTQQRVERLLQATLRGFDHNLSPSRPLFALNVLQHLVCKVAKLATRPPKSRFDAAYKRYLRGQYHARVRSLVGGRMNVEFNSLVMP
jgi:thiamine kinase-like enzyme